MLPTVYFPTDEGPEVAIDSTPIIRRLESMWSKRSVVPAAPGLAFLNALIEDFADEWLTKCMFHYRWTGAEDVALVGNLIVFWTMPTLATDDARRMAKMFSDRQINRLSVVGSSETTGPTIEASYRRLLTILDEAIARYGFVLGRRPASADFGLYGQLTQLTAVDPTPTALTAAAAPRVRAWVDRMEDLSGLEPTEDDWLGIEAALEHAMPLLEEIGRVYVPFLIANGRAAAAGEKEWTAEIDGRSWTQATFSYQAKCWMALRAQADALPADAKAGLIPAFKAAGCAEVLRA